MGLTPLDDLADILADASPVYVAAGRFPAALVRRAVEAGVASEWEGDDCPVGRALVLSSLECERRGLELADDLIGEALEHSRWVRAGSIRPARPPRAAEEGPEADVAGDETEPLEALIAREEEEAREAEPPAGRPGRRVGDREPPRPTVIVGSSTPCWSRAHERPGAEGCRACGGRMLRPGEYCLGCSRSGADARPARSALARA